MTDHFFKKRKDQDPSANISREEAERLLEDILTEMDIDERADTRKHPYYFRVLRRCIIKNAAIVCGVLLICFMAPGTVTPAPITSVSAAPASDDSSVKVEFSVSTLIPVQKITANLNDEEIVVEENGFQSYSVEVKENGYLLLEVYSATGFHSSHGMEIDSIDDQSPHITGHFERDGNIFIYLTDNGGVGVDYSSIQAYDQKTGSYSTPLYYDEKAGYVVFPYPQTEIYIIVPDKKGNQMTALLSPTELSD